ncbi:hypothetical protein BH11BAC4_BH11BAC4_25760 [soil metagenome]
MRNTFFLLTFILASFIAVGQSGATNEFIAGKEGLKYKIISRGGNPVIGYGNFMQLHFATFCNGTSGQDSLLSDSRKSGAPVLEKLDSVAVPPGYFDILSKASSGDSIVIKVLVDSLFKTAPEQMPPFLKKGDYITTGIKILHVFTNKEEADSARKIAMAEAMKRDSVNASIQVVKEEAMLQSYFLSGNIKPFKAPKGTYINIVQKGTGPNATKNDKVTVNYTGRTLAGKPFDSNTDPAFNHVSPFEVNLSTPGTVIGGWEEGLLYLNKGSKAVLYIPSALGYGARGAGGDIGPYEILIFEIEVLTVAPAVAAPKAADAVPAPVKPAVKAKPVTKKAVKPVSKPQPKKAAK